MASFFDTTIGQQVEFQRVLASAGFTDSGSVRDQGRERSLVLLLRVSKKDRIESRSFCLIQVVTHMDSYLTSYIMV